MRRRQWVREGDLITLQPWEFQDEKANVCMRYTKTQSLYLSRKGVFQKLSMCLECLMIDQINVKIANLKKLIPEEILANEELQLMRK